MFSIESSHSPSPIGSLGRASARAKLVPCLLACALLGSACASGSGTIMQSMKLQRAAETGDVETMKSLLAENPGLLTADSKMAPPLHSAAGKGQIAAMEYLLGQGVDVNQRREANGWTALHVAVKEKQVEAVEWLLSKGADPDADEGGGVTPRVLAKLEAGRRPNPKAQRIDELLAGGS